jgi:hypothetical protein
MAHDVQTELWNKFNLAENNPDPGGGMLYALRYDTDSLTSHRDAVVESIRARGASIVVLGDMLGIDLYELEAEDEGTAMLLVEELSVVNEALEYHKDGIVYDSIDALAANIKGSFIDGIISNDAGKKADAYNLVGLGIPMLVKDLKTAHAQNEVFSPDELRTVRELGNFAATQVELFGNHRVVIIGV